MLTRAARAAFLSFVLSTILLAGMSRAALPPQFGGMPTLRLKSRISTLDPALAVRPDEFTAVLAVFEPLMRRDASGAPAPLLLSELPEKSDDGLTYYFKLRDDVKFHDGSALDAADVLHTIQRLIKSRRSPYSWIFDAVKGTSAYRNGTAKDIAGIKIVDAQRFEVQLVKKNQNFLRYLCFPAAAIVPVSDRGFKPPIGTGPFKFVDMKGDGSITLEAYPDYHEGQPYLDGLKFSVVRNDDDAMVEFRMSRLDIVDAPADGVRPGDAGNAAGLQGSMKMMLLLDVNPNAAVFGGEANRAMVISVLDRASMAKVVLNGKAQAEYGNAKKLPGAIKKVTPAAKVTLWFADTGRAAKFLAQKVRHDLGAIGLDVELVPKQLSELVQYPRDGAPALVLREMPEPMSLPESLDRALASSSYITSYSTPGVKFQPSGGKAGAKYLYTYLLSRKTYFYYRPELSGVGIGAFDQLDLQVAGFRKK